MLARKRGGAARALALAALLCAATSFGACRRDEPAAFAPTPVRALRVEARVPTTGVRYSASVAPLHQVNLSFNVEGYVREITQRAGADGNPRELQPGDSVRSGDLLARIDDETYRDRLEEARAEHARAEASLRKGRADFQRAKALYDTQSLTATDYDAARKEFEEARAGMAGTAARIETAEIGLAETQLTAPMAGVLLSRQIEVGDLVRPGSVGFQLADLSSVKVVFGVPDVQLEGVEAGSKLAITTDSQPGKTFEGTITQIAPSSTSRSRVFEVEVTVPNAEGVLRPGMIASLVSGAADPAPPATTAVPLSAIVRAPGDPEGYAVAVVEADGERTVARLRPVALGELAGDDVIVTQGLAPGDRVIVKGASFVSDGGAIRVLP